MAKKYHYSEDKGVSALIAQFIAGDEDDDIRTLLRRYRDSYGEAWLVHLAKDLQNASVLTENHRQMARTLLELIGPEERPDTAS